MKKWRNWTGQRGHYFALVTDLPGAKTSGFEQPYRQRAPMVRRKRPKSCAPKKPDRHKPCTRKPLDSSAWHSLRSGVAENSQSKQADQVKTAVDRLA
jgi:hypothetical protein